MPTLPTYNSQRQLTTQQPIATQQGAGQQEEIIGNALGAVRDVATKWSDAMDVMQETSSRVKLASSLLDIEQKASIDTDYNNSETYYREITKAKSDALKGITNKSLSQKLSLEYDLDTNISNIKVQNIFQKKLIANQEVQLYSLLQTLEQKRYNAMSQTEADQIDKQMKVSIDSMVPQFVQPDVAYKLWNDIQTRVGANIIDRDIHNEVATDKNDSYILKELKKRSSGIYSQLDEKIRNQKIDEIENKIKKNSSDFFSNKETTKANNTFQMLKDLSNQTLTPETINNAVFYGDMDQQDGEKLKSKMLVPIQPETNRLVYDRLRKMQSSGVKQKEINKFLIDHFEQITDKDRLDFLNNPISKEDNARVSYNADALQNWAISNLYDNKQGKDYSPEILYDFYTHLQGKSGQQIDDLAQEIIRQEVKKIYPDTALMEDLPNFVFEQKRAKHIYQKQSKLKGKSTPVELRPSSVSIEFEDL